MVHYYVQHGERNDGHLRFMYKPFMETLRPLEDRMFVYRNNVDPSAIPAGSTFVWVGIHLANRVPWRELREKGVRTVYYQTEYQTGCAMTNRSVDEIWDYSLLNIDNCRMHRQAPLLRYVPVSVQTWVPAIWPQLSLGRLEFFGGVQYGRQGCYAHVDRSWVVKSEYSVWSETSFENLAKHSSGIFINIHKSCTRRSPVEPRVPLLLSTGAVVVSVESNLADEREYDGAFMIVRNMSNISRLDVFAHLQTRNLSKFKESFDARKIIRRASLL